MLELAHASGFLFDLDGVLTPTADVHSRAWKETFDSFLMAIGSGYRFLPSDYLAHVDGRRRYDGVRNFLQSRDIVVAEGNGSDPPGFGTIQAIGNMKNQRFNDIIGKDGIAPYAGSAHLLERLDERGTTWGVVSSSANAGAVLAGAGLTGRPSLVIDGIVAAELELPGKPDPAMFVTAAKMLNLVPADTVVVEDAVAGVEAGAAGHFGLVVGVARDIPAGQLLAAGADRVIGDLEELVGELG